MMASQSLSATGCRLSLENCLTNLFALTDLAGIKWRRLRSQRGNNMDVADDPVLASYSRCLNADMLCAWARVANNDGLHTPLSFMDYTKELWVFWYGDEPANLKSLISDLTEFEQGSWETTLLSYECRTFLFKALHNVIERCLLAKSFVRIGKWFLQPQSEADGASSSPLSFSFQNFFLHGDSTVCVSVEVGRHPPLYRLSAQHLKMSKTAAGSAVSPVVLAPYGLAGWLTGGVVSPADKSLVDWQQFYPLSSASQSTDHDVPSMVEVAVGGVRLKYPSRFVLTCQKATIDSSVFRPKPNLAHCEECLLEVSLKTTNDNMLMGNRQVPDDDNGSWLFRDPAARTNCTCGKTKIQKSKQPNRLSSSGQLSPGLDSKRVKNSFHRRTPPIDELLSSSMNISSIVGTSAVSHSVPTITSQAPLKDVVPSPTMFVQPSPAFPSSSNTDIKAVKQPPSIKSVIDEDQIKVTDMKPPRSLQRQKSVETLPTSASGQGVLSEPSTSKATASVADLNRRPTLQSSLEIKEDLVTDSMYQVDQLNAWLELPLKRFKPDFKEISAEPEVQNMPRPYTDLEHPLSRVKNESSDPAGATGYFLVGTWKSKMKAEPADPDPVHCVVTEAVTDSLMTETALKPKITDLDKMFDSEDEDSPAHDIGGTSGAAYHNAITHIPHSNGVSMASAHASGPISAADLFQIYPTPPSMENNNAFSPVDHVPDMDNESPESAVSRAPHIAKFLTVSDYQPLDLPSAQQPITVPPECLYQPWRTTSKTMASNQSLLMSPHLPSTLSAHQPAHSRSLDTSPNFYQSGRTPLNLPEGLQSPASVTSIPPKSVTGMLSSVEGPSTHGASTINAQSLPEAHSLLVNMALTDSVFNLYKDQNFESCNLCVCNMNILGNDLGLYLPREKCEAQFKCTCGFSAVTNRHNGFCSGLFYEDETDIMNDRDDRFDKVKIRALLEKSTNEVDKTILNHLKEQYASCVMSLLARFTIYSNVFISTPERRQQREFQDFCAIVTAALDTGQYIPESGGSVSSSRGKLQCLTRWACDFTLRESVSSTESVQLLKSLLPVLQEAVQKNRAARLWEHHIYKVSGPMTWQAFFKLAGRITDELMEPQPVPPLLVASDDDWLRQSPFALQNWDKLLLKPYSGERNVAYVVIAPEIDFIVNACQRFFRELSLVYEACQLGKHVCYQALRDGILRVGKKLAASLNDKPIAEWFNKLEQSVNAQKLRLLARFCRHQLAPLLTQQAPDMSAQESQAARLQHPPGTPVFSAQSPQAAQTDENSIESRYKDSKPKSKDGGSLSETGLVIYLIDPFSSVSDNGRSDVSRTSVLGLLMCYQELLDNLPESIRKNTQLQIVPLHAILGTSNIDVQLLRSMAFSVFSRIQRKFVCSPLNRSLTGFGPVADLEPVLASRQSPESVLLPPYILAPMCDRMNPDELAEEDKSRVLFCAYCLSEDQRWILCSVVDDRGELHDTTIVNVYVPNRSRRKKATVLRQGLQQIFEFLIQKVSQTVSCWRLVVGRFGRLGHGELKVWAKILSQKSLLRASKQMRECSMCSSLPTDRQLGILGACVISIESHAAFSLLYNEPNKEDKKGNTCPLSTPSDASVTHILVIPNSTTAGGNQSHSEAPIDFTGDGVGTDILPNLDDDLDFNIFEGFGAFDNLTNSPNHSPPGSPAADNLRSQFSHPGGINQRRSTVSSMAEGQHEGRDNDQVNLLQQPLAMGYIVSTAPTGRLPRWFWSASPHAENSCPIVLKSALHFHRVCANQSQDDMGMPNSHKHRHPLDSNTTCDVLRYVLDYYNRLSWLMIDPVTNDRLSCLPVHISILMNLYHAINTFT